MNWKITGSVGRWEKGGRNSSADVETVQKLLTAVAKKLSDPRYDPKGIDGKIARPPKFPTQLQPSKLSRSGPWLSLTA